MGKVFKNKECSKCHKTTEIVEVFGTKYCKECYMKKPKSKHPGHSGMLPGNKQLLTLPFDDGLNLKRTTKGDKTFATLFLEHYPESKGIMGRQLNYFIKDCGEIIGIIGFNSPPIHYKIFDDYFGRDKEKNFLNNNVFRIIRNGRFFASEILALTLREIRDDYPKKYNDDLIGVVTFVEPPRKGTLYKADNWDFLGYTKGVRCYRRGSLGKWMNKEWKKGTVKLIYGKKFRGKK